MMIIRPVKMDDLEDIFDLASKTGTGLTTLPSSKEHLVRKIESSIQAFNIPNGEPKDESYLFVLEESRSQKVVGTSGIVAAVGSKQPFYTYKVNTEVRYSQSMDIYRKHHFLTLTNDFTNTSEICTLFLSADFRGGRNGMLLSKSRFLFIAQHPQRFCNKVIAEMRGISDDEGHSAFWESVGRQFFGIDFESADIENGEGNNQFIAELMPHHPIYVPLLSKKAQAVIGEVHAQTRPALQMLKAEGFRYDGYVDIFDAGPTIESPTHEIRSIKESFELKIKSIHNSTKSATLNAMVSNNKLKSFRACLTELSPPEGNEVSISPQLAEGLLVKPGDKIRVKFY